MSMKTRTLRKFSLMIALLGAAALSAGTGAGAYTVVTRDGHIIQTQARPEIRGLQAFMRLTPHGQLAVIQEEMIDWSRTDAVNPAPAVIALPADARMTQTDAAKPPARPIEMKIHGNAPSKETTETPATAQAAPPAAPGDGSAEQKKVNAQEAIIKLQKEFAQVSATRDTAVEKKKSLEAELASIQSKQTGYVSEDSSSAKRIRELEQEIASAGEEIGRCDARLSDIRAEAVQMGGSID